MPDLRERVPDLRERMLATVNPGWAPTLDRAADGLERALAHVAAESCHGRPSLPDASLVLRALALAPQDVRVLVVGQDPYPTPGHPHGLAFSVAPHVRPLPRSLVNVLTEWSADTGHRLPATGDLSPWAAAGVMLLNRVLTVTPAVPGSHRGKGWEQVSAAVVQTLVGRRLPLVAVLWGTQARAVEPLLGDVPVVASAHPSPLSAHRGFLGSRPFSRVDAALAQQGEPAVDWQLT